MEVSDFSSASSRTHEIIFSENVREHLDVVSNSVLSEATKRAIIKALYDVKNYADDEDINILNGIAKLGDDLEDGLSGRAYVDTVDELKETIDELEEIVDHLTSRIDGLEKRLLELDPNPLKPLM